MCDAQAVLSAINTLGAEQREQSLSMDGIEDTLTRIENRLVNVRREFRAGFDSVDEQLAEIKELIVRKLL